MRGAFAVAAAYVRAHRLVLWSAPLFAVLGHFSVVVAAFMENGRLSARDLVEPVPPELGLLLAVVSCQLMQMGLALVLGAGAVSRDLAERRIGFYLSRPLSPFAYWAGKMSAACFVACAAGWLVLLPGLLKTTWGQSSLAAGILTPLSIGLVSIPVLAAAGGAAAGAVRSRLSLLIIDLLMLPLTFLAFWLSVGSAWDAGTLVVLARLGTPWLLTVATLVLLAAGAAQVCLGRLDVRRGHAWLSTIAWGGLLACVLGMLLFNRSVASATPADLRLPHTVSLHAPRTGSHVLLEGIVGRWSLPKSRLWLVPSRFAPGFVLDAQGRSTRMGGFDDVTGFAWSDDGRHLAWSRGAPDLLEAVPVLWPSVWIFDSDQTGAGPRRVARNYELQGVRALSPSGKRVLIAEPGAKQVLDTQDGLSVASVPDSASWANARFLSETVVRALRVERGRSQVVEWDVGGSLTEHGSFATPAVLFPTDDWRRVLRLHGSGLSLHELDGRAVATLAEGWPTRMNRVAGPLSGNRFGSVEEGPEGLRLRVFDSEGRRLAESLIKGRFPLRVGGEGAPGLLALGMLASGEEDRRETLFIDLSTGGVVRREIGVLPALRRWDPERPGDVQNPEPASLATRLFLADEGLVLLDPATGRRSPYVRRRDRPQD